MKKYNKHCLVVPGTSFLHAYAGTRYLIEGLVERGVRVEVMVRCETQYAAQYRSLPWQVRVSPYNKSGNALLRKISGLHFKLKVGLRALLSSNLLVTESTFLQIAARVKKLKPGLHLVHYCQELQLLEDYPDSNYAQIYNRYARVPDLVIDVEPNRAAVRQQKVGLSHDPLVLLNTIPVTSVEMSAPAGTLAKLAEATLPQGVPVLLHTGGIGKEKPLERVIDAVAQANDEVFLLAFCNGREADITRLAQYAAANLKAGSFCIRAAVSHQRLLPAITEADIGVIDYAFNVEPTHNQKYCAPTKLYEFMAYGLALLGSANASLREIIEQKEIGACAADDSINALTGALNRLLSLNQEDFQEMKARARTVYRDHYSYEKCCATPLNKIVESLKES
jgi:glycosyltransferase involved in cell wall biosynthesis